MEEIDSTVFMEDSESVSQSTTKMEVEEQHILLFYHFHPLAKDPNLVELYRSALEKLCQSLDLQGRILVGCNDYQSEGINGTLAGKYSATAAFVQALCRNPNDDDDDKADRTKHQEHTTVISSFWEQCNEFYRLAGCEPLIMDPSEFKWSTSKESKLFPDLHIKIVKELIGTGGVLAPIPLEDVHQGYLTPSEWHQRIAQLQQDETSKEDTVLIDCRNTKEWQIGHFPGAPDPSTTTFNQFPTWVQQNSSTLANKKVLMYCTGGIRCEKASAFIRKVIPSVKEVCHLKGGIHKYLDQFGSSEDCLWKGKNFVFDARGAHGAPAPKDKESTSSSKEEIVGKCLYCPTPYDVFEPGCVCTVCRELTLVCPPCRQGLREYHCHVHTYLRNCYFTDLSPFTKSELESQQKELETLIADIAIGKKFKHKRKTLTKQYAKINERLAQLEKGESDDVEMNLNDNTTVKCRNCGQEGCSGACWGCHGLKRKRVLEELSKNTNEKDGIMTATSSEVSKKRNNYHLQEKKAMERNKAIDELVQLKLSSPPAEGRNDQSGIRIPRACTRTLQSNTKGKWCGRTLLSVLQTEFTELAQNEMLKQILDKALLRVNGKVVKTMEEAATLKLKNMDVIVRVNHWHEPPVHIPGPKIEIQKIELPRSVQAEFSIDDKDCTIIVCDKPCTVPVHPAGPYLSNSLTMMVEAQEGMTPKSLMPCHRIDRVTSGLTVCCTNPQIARLVQSRIDGGFVKKHYLAKTHGKFPHQEAEVTAISTDIASWRWDHENGMVEVDAPIETIDPANGIRKITSNGKSAKSLFRFIAYDETTDTSVVLCCPLTGRSHQLRLHLQWLGHSIVNDIQYGGIVDPNLDLMIGLVESNQRRDDDGAQATFLYPSSISNEDVKAATEICTFCTRGPQEAFSPAQLLQGGHAICLHAYRYQIPFHAKKTAASSTGDDLAPLAELTLQVGLPTWVNDDVKVE